VIRPEPDPAFKAEENVIAGNTILYGAISGDVFLNGRCGERFAVRNSGANAVVEGIGNHGCEYMTGGTVVILGPTGCNFGAAMSGGTAYVLDETGDFDKRCNHETVEITSLKDTEDIDILLELIKEHFTATQSRKAEMILDEWRKYESRFVKVCSPQYSRSLS
jgi:glutamate synthase (NADPH/NADH) large chain